MKLLAYIGRPLLRFVKRFKRSIALRQQVARVLTFLFPYNLSSKF
jgi:hypothetical protein